MVPAHRALLIQRLIRLLLRPANLLGSVAIGVSGTRKERAEAALLQHHRTAAVFAGLLCALIAQVGFVHVRQIDRQFARIRAEFLFSLPGQADALDRVLQFHLIELIQLRIPGLNLSQAHLNRFAVFEALPGEFLLRTFQDGYDFLGKVGGTDESALLVLDRHLGIPGLNLGHFVENPQPLPGNLCLHLFQVGFGALG